MTSTKCQRCGNYWSIQHNNPDACFTVINRFCPECVARVIPLMGVTPLRRRIA